MHKRKWILNGNIKFQAQIRSLSLFFFKNGQIPASFSLFSSIITISIILIEKRIDGVLGIRTSGCRMAGTDDTKELWRPRKLLIVCANFYTKITLEASKEAINCFVFVAQLSTVVGKKELAVRKTFHSRMPKDWILAKINRRRRVFFFSWYN